MRALFFFLLIANIGFFVWSRYYSPADTVLDRAPLARQIEPDRLKILGPGEPVSSLTTPLPRGASAGSSEPPRPF